jgi:hypothetical protein
MFLDRLLDSYLTSPQSASASAPHVTGALIIVALMIVATLKATQITMNIGPLKITLKKPRRRKRSSTASRSRR